MCRDMENLQRQVEGLTNVLDNPRIIWREASDDETDQGDVDQHIEHEEEQVGHMTFEERMLKALEGEIMGSKWKFQNM